MTIIDAFADLQKLEIVLYSFFIFFDVVVEYTYRIVRSAFVSHFSCSSTSKGKHLIILQSPHNTYIRPIIHFLSSSILLIGSSVQY